MLSPEELLAPRYLVIADFPQPWRDEVEDKDNCYKLMEGDIVQWMKVNKGETYRRVGRCGQMSVNVPSIRNPEKYPKIFQEIGWWMFRIIQEMPQYVRAGKKCYRVKLHFERDMISNQLACVKDNNGYGWPYLAYEDCVPITEEEYKKFIENAVPE